MVKNHCSTFAQTTDPETMAPETTAPSSHVDDIVLRDYQHALIHGGRVAVYNGYRRVLTVAPTGSGKTVIFSFIARNAARRGHRIGILVHRSELLKQTSRALRFPHGIIKGGITPNRSHRIQVATVQTLTRRLAQYEFDLLIVDECHHTTASTWMNVINANPNAVVLGYTATPIRQSGQALGDVYDHMVVGPTQRSLIDQGHLSPYILYQPEVIDKSKLHKVAGDYIKKEMAELMDKPKIVGCAIAQYRKHAHNHPAIAFCPSVESAERYAQRFRDAGYQSSSIDGKMSDDQRDRLITDLGNGRLHVLTSCDLISEGVDVPVVSCGIFLRPTASLGLYLQQVGRMLRPAPGKTHAILLDHVGHVWQHGLPDEDRRWDLQTGLVAPTSDTADQEKIRQCPTCFAIHDPAPTCPYCGHVYEIKSRKVQEVEGELHALDPKEFEARRKYLERRELQGKVNACRTEEDLYAIAKAKGYKPGWVHYQMDLMRRWKYGVYRHLRDADDQHIAEGGL